MLPASIAGLPTESACVRVGPPLKASAASCGSTAIELPVPLIVMLHVEQIDSISEFVALAVNDGMTTVAVPMSADTVLFARIDDTTLSVGGVALPADGGVVAPVVIRTPPVRLGGAALPLIVAL